MKINGIHTIGSELNYNKKGNCVLWEIFTSFSRSRVYGSVGLEASQDREDSNVPILEELNSINY